MAATNKGERRYIHAARLITIQDASDWETLTELIDQGQQVMAMIPSNTPRDDYDALTERLIDVAAREEANALGCSGWRSQAQRLARMAFSPERNTDPDRDSQDS